MQKIRSRTLATVLGVTVGITLLAGCSAAPAPTPAKPDTSSSPAPEESKAPAAASDGTPAEWAKPVSTDGDLITNFTAGDISIDVYQIAVTQATKTGNFADPNGKPIISVGDDIVFINYVVTNNGDAVDLGASLANVSARYADWPYLQGMDAITDSALYESMGLSTSAFATGKIHDPSVYTLGKGESYNMAANFRYQKDSPIDFTVTVTPVDSSGDLLHDKKIEGEGNGVIK